MTRELCKYLLKDFVEDEKYDEILLFIPDNNIFLSVAIGGTNVTDGYMLCTEYKYSDNEFHEINSFQLDFGDSEEYKGNISSAVYDVLNAAYSEVDYFIPLCLYKYQV